MQPSFALAALAVEQRVPYLAKEISTSLCVSRGALMKSFDFHKKQQGGSP